MDRNTKENSKARLLKLNIVRGDTLAFSSVTGASVVQNSSISVGKKGGVFHGQSGSSLVIAVAFIVLLFVITGAAIRYSVSSAKSGDATSIMADETWRAKELSAYSTGWITEKLPKVFRRELQAAMLVCGNQNLPAFNPESSSGSAACENSLLGNFQAWLDSKIPAIEQFARDQIRQDETATVGAVLTDGGRAEIPDKTESSYLVNYLVDTKSGAAGVHTKQGQVYLGATWYSCTAEASIRRDVTIQAGQTAVLSGEYYNASKLELLENGVKIWQLATIDRQTQQTYTVSVSPAATSNYTILAHSNVAAGCITSSVSTVAVTVTDPLGSPIVTPTPTPTPTPPLVVNPPPAGQQIAYQATWMNNCTGGEQFLPPTVWEDNAPFPIDPVQNVYLKTFNTGRFERIEIKIQTDMDSLLTTIPENSFYIVNIPYKDLFQMETSRTFGCAEGQGFENWHKTFFNWERLRGTSPPVGDPFLGG